MLLEEFLAPRILIVSGKGGTGKTTVAAALAVVAARRGRRVCVAEVDRKGSLPKLFGRNSLSYGPSEMAPGIWGINIVPEQALEEYLEVQYRMRRVAKVFTSTQFIDYVTTAAPGLKDILVLGKIWYLEQGRRRRGEQGDFDTIILDAPAAGHMLTFLSAPLGLSDAVRVGPVRRQAEWLVEMLRDPERARIHLVTLAEEMPVSETLETSRALAERLRVATGPVFANAVYPEVLTPGEAERLESIMEDGRADELAEEAAGAGIEIDAEDLQGLVGYARFLQHRRAIQAEHLGELKSGIDDPVVELPFLFSGEIALPQIEELADALEERVQKL